MKGTSGMFAVCYRWRQTLHWLCKTTDVCLRFKLNCLKWTRRQNWDELEVTCFWQNFRWIIQVSDYFFETQLTEKETQEGAFKKNWKWCACKVHLKCFGRNWISTVSCTNEVSHPELFYILRVSVKSMFQGKFERHIIANNYNWGYWLIETNQKISFAYILN